MKQISLNQKGFAIVETLLILVIGAIIGGTGYYVYQSYAKSTDSQNKAHQNAEAAAPHVKKDAKKTSAQYLTIKEWGVRAPIDNAITPQYAVTTEGSQQWVKLSSAQLVAADPKCNVDNSAAGIIGRAKPDDHAFNNAGDDLGITVQQQIDQGQLKSYKKVGAYYYWYQRGQAFCGDAAQATMDLQDKTDTAFKTAVDDLEAIAKQ